jgi:hypothetical protein
MESVQYKALYRIAGAFRTTSRAALEVCLHVPPPMITLIRAAEESCLRILSSPGKDPLTSPLHRLEYVLDRRLGRGTVDRLEEI